MDARHLDLAAEFCALTGSQDLLSYLNLSPPIKVEEAQAKLKERRRYMQGMQANPKYRQEALALIRNMSVFQEILDDPEGYLAQVRGREQAAHLPVLELTLRSALSGGTPGPEQDAYLRRNAQELGISEALYEATFARIAAELGVDLEARPPPADPYRSLGVAPGASLASIEGAYQAKLRAAATMSGPRAAQMRQDAEAAWAVLRDDRRRSDLEATMKKTGLPARQREFQQGAGHAQTVPPAPRAAAPSRLRRSAGGRASTSSVARPKPLRHVEMLGDPIRRVSIRGARVTTQVRIRMDGKVAARVSSDQPWLMAEPTRLPVGTREETLKVRIDPQGFSTSRATGLLTVQTEDGERVAVAFEVERRSTMAPAIIVGGLLVVACVAGAAIAGSIAARYAPLAPSSLTVTVEPTSQEVLLEGKVVGSGSLVRVDSPPTGIVSVEVRQDRFRTWRSQIEIPPGRDTTMPVVLELDDRLDFVPTDDMQRAALDQDIARRVMTSRTRELDECIRQGAPSGFGATGSLRIHVGEDGRTVGVELDEGVNSPSVLRCVERQAALLQFPALQEGTYATLRYDYAVAPQGSP